MRMLADLAFAVVVTVALVAGAAALAWVSVEADARRVERMEGGK